MRVATAVAVLFTAASCVGADEAPMATRVIEGAKTTFPAESIPNGVKSLIGVLESCHDVSDGTVPYTTDDVKKAQRGDSVRFVFPRPLEVDVRGKKVKVSAAVFTGGVFWLDCGKKFVRCTKYTHEKWEPFVEWYRQTLPADRRLGEAA